MKKEKRSDIVARADDAFGSSNYAEFVVEKKVEGSYKTHRMLMILAYVIVIGVLVGLFISINPFMVAIAPIIGWILIFFTWPLVSIEYKYTIDNSVFTGYAVYGGKRENPIFSCKVKDFSLIAPDNDKYSEEKDAFSDAKTVSLLPTENCPDRYFALYTSETGEKSIVYFRATGQALKAFKYYNSAATVVTEVSR
ncbi:MAG: hypothetical protein ACI3XR_03740 [Eubacteriales bacterium]